MSVRFVFEAIPRFRRCLPAALTSLLCFFPTTGDAVGQGSHSFAETPLRHSAERIVSAFDVADVAIDRVRRIYILQRQARQIIVANAQGSHIRTIDLRPMQPAEFAGPPQLGIYLNFIWVSHPLEGRITWLSDEGLLERVDVIRPSWRDSVGTGNELGGPLADGLFYGTPSILSPVLARGLVTRVPFLRINRSGQVFDTLLWIGVSPHQTAVVKTVGNGPASYLSQFIRDRALVSISPSGDYVLVADRAPPEGPQPQEFIVRRVGILGDTVAQVNVRYVPVATTEKYLDALLASRRMEGRLFGGRVDEGEYRRAMWKPRYLPPLESLWAGIDGSIWMAMTTSDVFEQPEREWLVLSPSMNQRFRVKLPKQLLIVQASLDEVWGILRDDRGVSHVYRYDLCPFEGER